LRLTASRDPARMAVAIVIGGGAAGCFAAITCAEVAQGHQVHVLEGSATLLAKVRISGGGRCNVTHDCPEPRRLVQAYPRGSRELLGPFARFGPVEAQTWFAERGVPLVREADGRLFPATNQSATVVECLVRAMHDAGVLVHLRRAVRGLTPAAPPGQGWLLATADGPLQADAVLMATGSARPAQDLLRSLGLPLVEPVPSLFTFTCAEAWITDLAGVAVEDVRLALPDLDEPYQSRGPLLCTHWGVSGPAVLKASAWAARSLHRAGYRCRLIIDWLPDDPEGSPAAIADRRRRQGAQLVRTHPPSPLPRRLWEALLARAGIDPERTWAQLTAAQSSALHGMLHACPLQMVGKGVFKEEFVTAGGVDRAAVSWRSMESRRHPGLFVAGECLDVDAITGGYNFQHAWTSGYLAGLAMAQRLAGVPA
jgi:predicted Rossmann fold flavoprotein